MRISLVTPELASARSGNWVTAARYARIFRQLGHRVALSDSYDDEPSDVLVALHARRSASSIRRFCDRHPNRPLILVLTGTDLYRDIKTDANARQSLELATRLVVLQTKGVLELEQRLRSKVRVIYQSVSKRASFHHPPASHFKVSVIGHLRPEKDPFRAALAARLLPASSRVRVLHVGSALSQEMERTAREEQAANPRYRWIGGMPHWRVCRVLASSHLLAQTSLMEGSSNAVCEAVVSSVPVVASRISGLIGTLGDDYPGFFPAQDTQALARLLERAEQDPSFYRELEARCSLRVPLLAPERERACWAELLAELG